MSSIPFSRFILIAAATPAFAAATGDLPKGHLEFFENKIRPILKENCYKCHSLEAGKAKGGLTLDTRDGWEKGGENGSAMEPGAPDKSLIVKAISYEDPDLQMPPKGEKLSPQQIADMTAWVKMGAPDPRKGSAGIASKLTGLTDQARHHWAYQPVKKAAPPAVRNNAWLKNPAFPGSFNPIDPFILQKLESANMVPAPEAEKATLLRRATYDLIGLPPAPHEVAAFLADTSPNAFEKVIDRLLASPHYGERWGRHWLDTARYSDTIGGERNAQRRGADYRYPYAWTYRDYVIDAFNSDKPYDQFIVEQIAADHIPNRKDDRTLAALGFLTVGERFRNPNDIINDRIDVVSKGFLAMTVTCARCHDHMFDPIPTKDYYALHGVFSSTFEPDEKPVIAAPQHGDQLADFEAKKAALENENRAMFYKLAADVNGSVQSKIGPIIQVLGYGGKKGGDNAKEIKERNDLLNKFKVDRDELQIVQRNAKRDIGVFSPARMLLQLSEAEFAEKAPAIVARIASGNGNVNALVVAAFKGATLTSKADVVKVYEKLFADLAPKLRAYVDAQTKNETLPDWNPELAPLLGIPLEIPPVAKLTTEKIRDIVGNLQPRIVGRAAFTFAKINELELTHPGAPARAMLVADAKNPKNSPVFIRGQAETRGDVVPRRFLEVLSPEGKPVAFSKENSGRLELAHAIASKANPLTARVLVNRVWMHHFGEGFVPTTDDLGTQSELPSHPELLDFLASYFMEKNWSVKSLHKLIMLSRVYQESSRTNPAFETKDPQNRLLWRANIRRLDFESTRDSLLVFSGNLDRSIGGKPINLTDEPYSYRRSVYGYIDRGNLPELMAQFDFSDPDMPNSKRATSIVPQQALFLMNSSMAVDVARRILDRPEVAGAPDNLGRIFAIYRVIFQRDPKPEEIKLALKFVGQEITNDSQAPAPSPEDEKIANRKMEREMAKAKQVNKNRYGGMAPIKNTGSLVERTPLTPWQTYAQALLLSNEAAYVN